MNLLGPTFLLVLVALVAIVGVGTMLIAMRSTLRRGREAHRRADDDPAGSDPRT